MMKHRRTRDVKPGAADTERAETAPRIPSAPQDAAGWWPDEFCRPRTACFLVGAIVAWGALLFGLAAANRLLWLKIIIGWLIGLWRPDMVNPYPWDLAIVGWCLGTTVLAGLIHPAAGLAVLGFLRPWLDGYTYARDNIYFFWAACILFALWAARVMLRGERIRAKMPLALLAGFLAVAAITSAASIQYGRSFRELLLWSGYFALFVLTANSIRTRRTANFLLIALAVTMAAQTIFSLLHFYYLLPFLRTMMARHPQLLQYYFDTDVMTPELARRFNVNRAFGSMLFPNALAAFLILVLPYHAAAALAQWQRVRALWRPEEAAGGRTAQRYRALALGVTVWFGVFFVLYACGQFAALYQYEDAAISSMVVGVGIAAAILALLPAVLFFWIADGYGAAMAGRTLLAAGLSVLTALQCWALWLTYSRGGMLALFAGTGAVAALYWGRRLPLMGRWLTRVAALALIAAVGAGALMGASEAPSAVENTEATTAGPSREVTQEGIHVSMKDLADPATFSLRLSYWRVGMRMFWNHFWTGVGLRNFGTAYPKYQHLGAGEVTEAHNSFLQIFCETGVVGGLLMAAFWAWIVLAGVRGVLRESNRQEQAICAALLAGILAFLAHSLIDINFSHPSLMMFLMLYAGLLCARLTADSGAQPTTLSERHHLPSQVAGLAFLLGAALLLGMSMRVYVQDLALTRVSFINLKNQDDLNRRFQAGRFLCYEVPSITWNQSQGKELPDPRIAVATVDALLGDINLLHEFGPIAAPLADRAKGMRRVQPGEPMPSNAILVIGKPWRAIYRGRNAAFQWIDELEYHDSRFPHDVDLALHLSYWCELMVLSCVHEALAEQRKEYLDRMIYWAETAVRRSPMHADVYMNYGRLLWTRADFVSGPEKETSYRLAIEQFQKAAQLNATQILPLVYLADGYRHLSKAYREIGNTANADRFMQQADETEAQWKQLQQARQALEI